MARRSISNCNEQCFEDIVQRAIMKNAAALARKSFTAARLARIVRGVSQQKCLELRAEAISQLLRIGGAADCPTLAPTPDRLWLDLTSGGRLTIRMSELAEDVRLAFPTRADLDAQSAA